jgi:nucleoside-diphosphate kinase
MAGNRTLAIIKPDVVQQGAQGKVIDQILNAGFQIRALKLMQLGRSDAEQFYAVHKERPFFGELVEFMTSGPCIPMVLERADAVAAFRELIGSTDPAEAASGTVRNRFGTDKGQNAVHGSDSDENAQGESRFFFAALEEVSFA